MTFSIVARSDDGALHGVAVASKFLAAGAVAPAAEGGLGALSSQALPNVNYRKQGLMFLRHGYQPADAIAGMTAADSDSNLRQIGIVSASGESAAFTGTDTTYWAGHRTGHGYAIQGNILTGPEVVDKMEAAWLENPEMKFTERLVASLAAGDAAGGDSRGRQCASVLVVGQNANYFGNDDVAMDLRVDDHPEPIPELQRLIAMHREIFPTDQLFPRTSLHIGPQRSVLSGVIVQFCLVPPVPRYFLKCSLRPETFIQSDCPNRGLSTSGEGCCRSRSRPWRECSLGSGCNPRPSSGAVHDEPLSWRLETFHRKR